MEESGTRSPSAPDPRLAALPGAGWSDFRWLLLLLAFTAGLRAWQLTHTEVPSRDSVGYIRICWRLLHEDYRAVLPAVNQHPGYPAAMTPLAAVLLARTPDDPAHAMQMAARGTAALASLLLMIPVYYLGKELFDRRVGFWAGVLIQCLPATGRLMADGLCEPVFLLFAVGGLACAARGLRAGGPGWFAGAGLLGGLAYLTRVEGVLVVFAAGLALLAFQAVPRWRRAWPDWLHCGAALATTAALVAVPYVAVIGSVTVKPIKYHLLQHTSPRWAPPAALAPGGDHAPLPWAIWYTGQNVTAGDRAGWAAYAVGVEAAKASCYVLWLPALLGMAFFADRLWRVPGSWAVVIAAAGLLALLYRVAQTMGYLSERHLALVVLLGLYPAVAAVAVLAGGLARRVAVLRPRAGLVTAGVLAALAAAPLPRTLGTLHGDRVPFRLAGEWLARHVGPGEDVVDPYSWASYYAGRVFTHATDAPDADAKVLYVVWEEGGSEHNHLWWLLPEVRRLKDKGQPVETFSYQSGKHHSEVTVYRVTRS